MSVKDYFESLDYAPAPESPSAANAWLDAHDRKFDLFINGRWQAPTGGKRLITSNPVNGKQIAEVADAAPEDVDAAYQAARTAFESWSKLSGHTRARHLYGIARGIYANEAGYGTAAVAYGTARSTQPAQQGLNAVMETFIVSYVTSTISAMTILLTGAWQSGLTSTAAVAAGFNSVMPLVGGYIVAFCTFLFGYTTLIGWAYYGEQFFEYILGRKVTIPYRWIYCLLIPFGAISRVEVVWAWGDLMNALQVFPNLIGVIGLSGIVARAARAKLRTDLPNV